MGFNLNAEMMLGKKSVNIIFKFIVVKQGKVVTKSERKKGYNTKPLL